MAVSMADITKLRKMTGAGMMDCKNALAESEGDFDNVKLQKVACWLNQLATMRQ